MRKLAVLFISLALVLSSGMAVAADKATPEDVYNLVIKAHEVLKSLGDEGLAAFNDPKGEFVLKDTYVFVLKCPKEVVAHPFAIEKLRGKDLRKDFPFQIDLCNGAKDSDGTWVEYKWPKPGETEPSRKIAFVISVEGTPYQVVAGIYNDDVTVEELNGAK